MGVGTPTIVIRLRTKKKRTKRDKITMSASSPGGTIFTTRLFFFLFLHLSLLFLDSRALVINQRYVVFAIGCFAAAMHIYIYIQPRLIFVFRVRIQRRTRVMPKKKVTGAGKAKAQPRSILPLSHNFRSLTHPVTIRFSLFSRYTST